MTHYIIENNRWEKPRYYCRRDWVKDPMLATSYVDKDIAARIIDQLKRMEPKLQLMKIDCDPCGGYSLRVS
jgi:hypothetical protein